MTETRLGLDLGDAGNAPDDTVTIKRVGNNMRLTSPAAGSIDLEDFVLPGGVHALEDHTDVDITAAATGEILRFDGADWVDVANSAMDSSDSSVLGVLRAIDAAGNVVFNEDSLDIDYRMESNTNTHAFFLQGSDGRIGIGVAVPEGLVHLAQGDSGIAPSTRADDLVMEGTGRVGISLLTDSLADDTQLFFGNAAIASADYGGLAYFFDGAPNPYMGFRSGGAYRMVLDSTGQLGINDDTPSFTLDVNGSGRFTGDLTIDGEILGDLMLLTFGRAVVPQMNGNGEALELNGILCTAGKGFHVAGAGSIVAMGINYNVDGSVGGAAMEYGVAVDGGSVFAEAADEAVADNKVEEAFQARGTDTITLDDNLTMFVAETGSQNLDLTDVLAWVILANS